LLCDILIDDGRTQQPCDFPKRAFLVGLGAPTRTSLFESASFRRSVILVLRPRSGPDIFLPRRRFRAAASKGESKTHVFKMLKVMGDEMDASIHRTGVAMRHTGIGRP
jgi:hypothetical protein